MKLICDKCHTVFESESLACPQLNCGGVGSGYVNAIGARNLADIGDMFAEVERHDIFVSKVLLPHSLGKKLKKQGEIDSGRLWTASVKVLEEDLLPVWDEERLVGKKWKGKRTLAKKPVRLPDGFKGAEVNVMSGVIVSGEKGR